MRHSFHLVAPLLTAAIAAGCTDNPATELPTAVTPAPTLASANGVIAGTVGQPFLYDAAKANTAFRSSSGATLTYRITFESGSNGLSANGATLVGFPAAPAVAWATITATDPNGKTATDRFAVVAFSADLAMPTTPATAYRYTDAANPLPAHFTAAPNGPTVASLDNTPATNPITDGGAALGRVLFYDLRLSANDGLSCGGCHSPFIGFSDRPQFSVGFGGGLTGRHAPALSNARFYQRGRFFWDERAATLEDQVLGPIQNPVEMGMTLENLVAKLQATTYYPPLFQVAFGTNTITSDRVARALAQYVRSLVSTNSRFDRAFTTAGGPPNFAAVFTPQEIEGEQLFRTVGCAQCHGGVSQILDAPHNIGLDLVSTDTGAGRGTFKAPSLRNVAIRPRFMHDGRFASLAEVVEFYNSGVQPNANLDPRLRTPDGTPRRLNLTASQKAALVAFLGTLTDTSFLTAERFSNPFARMPVTVLPPAVPTVPTTPTIPTTPTVPTTPVPSPVTASVTIQATAYHPASVTVAPGAVITWTNLDNARHSARFLTAGVGETPIFTSGSQQLRMPTATGTYNYQCAVHGAAMRGVVVVQ